MRLKLVTMADKGGADRAIKEPNPVIDGRKANVNLAYLGAKPRGPAADASSSLLLRQVAASQPYFATTQLLQQRAAFQPVNMAQAAAAASGAYGNHMAAAAAAGMTTQLRYPIPSPTLVAAGGTGTMSSIDYGGLQAISAATDPYGVGSTAVTAAASSTTTGEMPAIPDSPSDDYADSPNSGDGTPPPAASPPVVFPSLPPPLPAGAAAPTNNLAGSPLCYNTTASSPDAAAAAAAAGSASTQLPQRVTSTSRHLRLHPYSSIPLTGVRYPAVLPGQYGIHPNYVYHPSFMQTAAGLLPMAATAPVAHASQLAATQAYYDYAATAATAAYPATYPTAATAAAMEPYAAAVSAASAMYGTGYSWQQAAAAQAAAVAASAGNIPGFSYATQPQMAQEAARMQ